MQTVDDKLDFHFQLIQKQIDATREATRIDLMKTQAEELARKENENLRKEMERRNDLMEELLTTFQAATTRLELLLRNEDITGAINSVHKVERGYKSIVQELQTLSTAIKTLTITLSGHKGLSMDEINALLTRAVEGKSVKVSGITANHDMNVKGNISG